MFSNRIVSSYLLIKNKNEAFKEIKEIIKKYGLTKKTLQMLIKYFLNPFYNRYKKYSIGY